MRIILVFLTIVSFATTNAYSKETVNVLGWENYLHYTDKLIEAEKKIEKMCDTTIAYDEYSNYSELIKYLNKSRYDIVISSGTFFNILKSSVPNDRNPKLEELTKKYNPSVYNHFESLSYPNNVSYFTQSLTGFIINTNKINIKSVKTIRDLFRAFP